MGKFVDMSGEKYHRLTALRVASKTPEDKRVKWVFRCDCGTELVRPGFQVRYGLVKSCGCYAKELAAGLRKTHGRSGTRTHKIWKGMRERCLNPCNSKWAYYGGRGITVCERWNSFKAFLEDMGECPEGMSIDRLDNSRGYEPGNCRWATKTQQARNQRSNRMIAHGGKVLCLAEWEVAVGMPRWAIAKRLERGWSVERALTEPLKNVKRKGAGT